MTIKKVLIVDDSPTDLSNLKNILSSIDCEIVTANNGKEAITKANTEKPDIIFMDIVMEKMDGYEAARTITNDSATKSIPLIFVSSKNKRRIASGQECKVPKISSLNPTQQNK